MEGGHLNRILLSDNLHDVPMTPTLQILTSDRLNQYALSRRVRTTGSPGVNVAIYRDTQVNDRQVLVKAVRRQMPEDRYRQLRRNFRTGNNFFSGEQSVRKEAAVLSACRHPNIVQLFEVIDDASCDRVFLVLEYLGGGEIQWRNHNDEPILTVAQSKRIFRDATLGLQYLHQSGVVHGDLKPANLVWSSDQQSIVKIIDFGISHIQEENLNRSRSSSHVREKSPSNSALFTNEELTKQRGTWYFMAPEVAGFPMDGTSVDTLTSTGNAAVYPKRPIITKAIDIWSLAVTFHYHTRYMLFKEICTQDWTVPDIMGADELPTGGRVAQHQDEVIALLDYMLRKDPTSRISIDQVKSHPWVLSDIPRPREWLDLTSPYPVTQSWAKQAGHKMLAFLQPVWSTVSSMCR